MTMMVARPTGLAMMRNLRVNDNHFFVNPMVNLTVKPGQAYTKISWTLLVSLLVYTVLVLLLLLLAFLAMVSGHG